ncbi:MAG: hypothetical protein SVK08_07790 [Halobacteriota archaeon]|nr:hypothetical protein [Halobacteriota archaeon]
MPIEVLQFYHPLPRFGVKLSDQWNEFRDNFDSLAPLVRAAYVDIATSSGSHDLSGFAQGELNFRNRYRIFYDKAAEEWKLQYNQGTEATEDFIDYVRVRNVDGRFIVEAPGGLESANGFYNFDYLTVSSTRSGGFSKAGVDTITVNSDDGLYWTVDSQSNPILNLSPSFFYLKVRESESGTRDRFIFDQGAAGLVYDSAFFYVSSVSDEEEVLITLNANEGALVTSPNPSLDNILIHDGTSYREARFDPDVFYLSTGGDGKLIISLR